VMRFCQAFMIELSKHIWADTDVPAGDIGVWAREIGYMFGIYIKLRNEYTGVLTGKGLTYGGSLIRTEATGYGVVYFLQEILATKKETLTAKRVLVSGSGNVAQYAIEKAMQLGAKVISASDSDGTIEVTDGFTPELLAELIDLKNVHRGRLEERKKKKGIVYHPNKTPRHLAADIALPCATQNELELSDAKILIKNWIRYVVEWANMPTTLDATHYFQEQGIIFAPGKAANAGGVATSWLEMSQNSLRLSRTREEVDEKLQKIMKEIHATCIKYGTEGDKVNYVTWANIGGFVKVAEAMLAQGVV
jgi:glutamate dehydrogenase (NADP+)